MRYQKPVCKGIAIICELSNKNSGLRKVVMGMNVRILGFYDKRIICIYSFL